MKKNYVALELNLLLFSSEDIVTASVADGVNVQWDDGWNTGEWAED